GWSVKDLHRTIVRSATYRQSSKIADSNAKGEKVHPQLQDPYNRLLARGPRLRVDAEMVRDIALSASGLLNDKVGGPSVFPPLPPDATGVRNETAGKLRPEDLAGRQGCRPLPAGILHLPLSLAAISGAANLRCPQRRCLLRAPASLQHAAPGAHDAQ